MIFHHCFLNFPSKCLGNLCLSEDYSHDWDGQLDFVRLRRICTKVMCDSSPETWVGMDKLSMQASTDRGARAGESAEAAATGTLTGGGRSRVAWAASSRSSLPCWALSVVLSDSATPWTAVIEAFLSFVSLLKLMSIESGMPSNHLILCHPILLLPSVFPDIRGISSGLALPIMWPKYWRFSFSINPSNGYSE